MTYLLIIFVVAVALAPLAHFMPSKRQREIARMREYAAVHGLFVEFRTLPGAADGAGGRRPGRGHDIIYYGKRLPPSRDKAAQRAAWLRAEATWRSLVRREPLPPPPGAAPPGLLAASVDEGSCGIYWREAGGEEPVEQIRQLLEAWSGHLRT